MVGRFGLVGFDHPYGSMIRRILPMDCEFFIGSPVYKGYINRIGTFGPANPLIFYVGRAIDFL